MESIRSRRLASQGAMPGDGGKWDTDHDVGDDDILYGDSIRENDARENDSQRQRWLRRLRVNARGRDFTVNGMMYDVRTGDLYDFCGGPRARHRSRPHPETCEVHREAARVQ